MEIPDDIDFEEWVNFIGQQESQQIHSAGYYKDRVLELIAQGPGVQGDTLPWNKTHDQVGLRTGELTCWAGYNGHRKSLLTSYVMLHLAKLCRVAVASMEMSVERTLARMAAMAFAKPATVSEYVKFSEWLDDRLVIYDQLDSVQGEKILGFVHYCARALNCRHVFIDSLTKCGIAKDDMNAEKDLINRLQFEARALDVGIHLVCHMRKPQDENFPRRPNKYSIRGAGEISDLADNVFIVHVNKKKQELSELVARGHEPNEVEKKILEKSDLILSVDKQRNFEWEGVITLWHRNNQFIATDTRKIVNFPLTEKGESNET